ncbi:hypothetical protein X797_009773 [Metarhizium robertsii]|uniref:Uncharacterized protein n=2 Tax=Metarhizium robertsii TaxID=568076 RepID=E9FBR8_METRA|nr:uncharacterized protein MAA_09717 [Metarhizium robertsii ARSEF 23]EFY94784.1 hypothetical protein MAA_09717 [Metarhizium robertsii ARSEF 23]EXU97155.1 hypothetical protein X797_009773 [Metarhizium robertsii]
MKPSLTFVPVRLGLAAAAPQRNPDPSKYGLSKGFPDKIKKTLEDLKAINQNRRRRPTGATILSFLTSLKDLNKPPRPRTSQGPVWKKFASAAIAFVPTFGALGGLPGFLAIMKAITMGIFNAESPELAAKAEMKGKRFSDEATYEDLCNNCQPHLTISWLGRLNGCTKDKVRRRDGPDYRAEHPVRPSASKDEQIGLLLSSWIGGSLMENIHLLGTDDFRNAMRPACSGLLEDEKDVCLSKEIFQKAEEDFPSVTFCAPGKVQKSRQ